MLVVVQARTGSSRLPGKVLLPLAGKPLLLRMLERLLAARTPSQVAVATTRDPRDDAVVALARAAGVACIRGHATDLLDRHVQAAHELGCDAVSKIPSDCPLIDPAVVDRVIGAFLDDPSADYVSNLHPATWPDGFDVEVVRRPVLEIAHREAREPHEREHTTPFIWDRPDRFRLRNVAWDRDLQMTHRLTIDYPEDYAVIRAVFEALHVQGAPPFGLERILAWLDEHPDVLSLNQGYAGVNWYRHHLDDLKTVDPSRTRFTAEERKERGRG